MFGVVKNKLAPWQLWGLAAGAQLTWINSAPFDQLAYHFGPDTSREYLASGWSVRTPDELYRCLHWLYESGHHEGCMAMVAAVQAGANPLTSDSTPDLRVKFVHENLVALKTSQLKAWDLCRLVNVARWGFTCGMIDEDGAWRWIHAASVQLQQRFNAWSAVGDDFLLGYQFWDDGKTPHVSFFAARHWLTYAPDSPWRRIAWQCPLT